MKDKIEETKGKKSLAEKSYLDYATSTFGDQEQITYGLRLEESQKIKAPEDTLEDIAAN